MQIAKARQFRLINIFLWFLNLFFKILITKIKILYKEIFKNNAIKLVNRIKTSNRLSIQYCFNFKLIQN